MEEEYLLYSTGCPRCEILKKKLDEKHIKYKENNSVDEMLELGITTVPVLQVGDLKLDFVDAIMWVRNQIV